MTDIQLLQYAGHEAAAYDGLTVWTASTALKLTLHTNTYVPNRVTHTRVSDLTNELGSGSGYTAGGVALTGATVSIVAANSWTAQWAGTTAYKIGQIVRPTAGNGFVYRVAVAGTTAGVQPVWPTVPGQCITDGTVQWQCVGRAVVVLAAANLAPAWAAFSAGPFRHVVLSDRAEALAADQPLIGVYSFGSDQTGGGGDFAITFDPAAGVIAIPVP